MFILMKAPFLSFDLFGTVFLFSLYCKTMQLIYYYTYIIQHKGQ